MDDEVKPFLPLSPAALHILLCLAADARHGYAIMQEVARQSDGHYKLGPGTLYDNLQKLMTHGMVEEETRRRPASDDPRRRYYRLSAFGRRVLKADIERLKRVVHEAKLSLKEPYPGKA